MTPEELKMRDEWRAEILQSDWVRERIASQEAENVLDAVAKIVRVDPASIHGYVVIVHTHPASGECNGHMETAANVTSGMARTLAISYAERQTGA